MRTSARVALYASSILVAAGAAAFMGGRLSTLHQAAMSAALEVSCDGTIADCKPKIDQATIGTTVTVPPGTWSWDQPVAIAPGVRVRGAGSGRIVNDTTTSMTVGTGSRTFTTTDAAVPRVGDALLVAKYPNRNGYPSAARENWMRGSVTAVSGNSVTMNVTSTGGSGTWTFWMVARPPATTILNAYNNGAGQDNGATPLFRLNLGAASPEISDMQVVNKAGSHSSAVGVNGSQWIQPKALIHDMWFQLGETDSSAVFANTNQILWWNSSVDCSRWTSNVEGLQIVNNSTASPSWSSASTMGADDAGGATNAYVEDCDFHMLLTSRDYDSNTRAVFRANLLDNCSGGPHGADTSTIGCRHFEEYWNKFRFNSFGANCAPEQDVQWYVWVRGGTAVITQNDLQSISSQCGGNNRPNIRMTILNLQNNTGPYCCWDGGWPAPHQVGQGYGPGAVFVPYVAQRCYVGQRYDYYKFTEPVYVWDNTGTAGDRWNLADVTDACGHGLHVSDFIQLGRDLVVGTPKPGWSPYAYPHPARGGAQPTPTPTGSPSPSTTATASASATAQPSPTPSPTAPPPTPSPTPIATATSTATPTATATSTASPPTPTPSPSSSPTPTSTATPAQCTVPDMTGRRLYTAQWYWTQAGFDCRNIELEGSATSAIRRQSIPGGTVGSCADLAVSVTTRR